MTANRMICFLMQINKKLTPPEWRPTVWFVLILANLVSLLTFYSILTQKYGNPVRKCPKKRPKNAILTQKYGNPVRRCPKNRPKNVKTWLKYKKMKISPPEMIATRKILLKYK